MSFKANIISRGFPTRNTLLGMQLANFVGESLIYLDFLLEYFASTLKRQTKAWHFYARANIVGLGVMA